MSPEGKTGTSVGGSQQKNTSVLQQTQLHTYLGGQMLAANTSSYNKSAAKDEKRKMVEPQWAPWAQKP